jgi:hypothetical protein
LKSRESCKDNNIFIGILYTIASGFKFPYTDGLFFGLFKWIICIVAGNLGGRYRNILEKEFWVVGMW